MADTDLSILTGKIKAVLSAEGFEVEGSAFSTVGNLTATKDGETLAIRLTLAQARPDDERALRTADDASGSLRGAAGVSRVPPAV